MDRVVSRSALSYNYHELPASPKDTHGVLTITPGGNSRRIGLDQLQVVVEKHREY